MNILSASMLKTALAAFASLALFLQAAPSRGAAAAVIDDGYAGKVLQKIIQAGKLQIRQRIDARLSLDEDGKLLDCRILKGSDAGICAAAKKASPYGQPPYGLPTYVAISFLDNQAAAADSAGHKENAPATAKPAAGGETGKYLARITREIRDSIYIPQQTKTGTYHVATDVVIDRDGSIQSGAIAQGSGDKTLDKYVLQGITRAGKVTAPPSDFKNPARLNFTLKRN